MSPIFGDGVSCLVTHVLSGCEPMSLSSEAKGVDGDTGAMGPAILFTVLCGMCGT